MASLLSLEKPVLLGSETPRVWTRPLRELTPKTSLGFEVVEFAEEILGIQLLPWQRWLFIHGLELRPDGLYRFRTVLTLVARQNGKTTALNILTLWRLIMDGARVVLGTSTNLEYARRSWQMTVDLAKGSPAIFDEFKWPESRKDGRESLYTKDGAFYGIATASRTGGRSLSVDLLVLDEIREHRTWEAWSASSKTTNARPRGQRWAISNMGDDKSVVLNHLQQKAIAGEDLSLGIFEWSAPPGCDTKDRSRWPLANPALGHTVAEDTIASDESTDSEEVFRTEVLCQRVPTLEPLPFSLLEWREAVQPRADLPPGRPVFGISVAPLLQSAAIAGAAEVSPGVAHLGLPQHRGGVDWLPARCAQLKKDHKGARFVAMSTGAVAGLMPDLVKAGVEVELLSTTDLGRAYGTLQSLLQEGRLTHSGALGFEDALTGAVKRDVGEGLWSLGWRKATSDLTPIGGAALALWVLESAIITLPRIF